MRAQRAKDEITTQKTAAHASAEVAFSHYTFAYNTHAFNARVAHH